MGSDLYMNPPDRHGTNEITAHRNRIGLLLQSMKDIFDSDDITEIRKIAAEEIEINIGVFNADGWEDFQAMSRLDEVEQVTPMGAGYIPVLERCGQCGVLFKYHEGHPTCEKPVEQACDRFGR